MSDLNLAINLSAVDAASTVIHGVGDAIKNLASGNVMGAAVDIGKALLNVGASSVKMAGDYQAGMTSLVTGAGEAQSNIKLVSDGILQMAVDTGTSTQQLTSGMYMIESAGYHGADGLNVLKIAAEGAKVGNADLGVTANALTTMLHDYGMSSGQAASAMNGLITTVASGKTHLQDIAGAMGSILPLASSLGVAFPQVGGALATMTNAGMSAQQASQNLAASLRALSNPSSGATKVLGTMGLTAQQLKDTLSQQGLTGALQMVEDHVNKKFPAGSVEATKAFSALLGGATGVKVALMLGGKNMQTFEDNVKSVSGAMKSGSTDVTGWSLVQQDLNFQMAKFHEIGETAMIRLGQALLPMVTGAFSLLNDAMQGVGNVMGALANNGSVKGLEQGLGFLSSQLHDLWGIMTSVAKMILGQFTGSLDSVKNTAISLFQSALAPLFDILGNLNAGVSRFNHALNQMDFGEKIDAVKQFGASLSNNFGPPLKEVASILGGQFKADLTWLGSTFNQIGSWIKTSLMPALATLIPPFQSIATTIITDFLPAFAKIYSSIHQLMEAILTPLINVLEKIIPPVIRLAGLIGDGLAAAFKAIGPLVKGLADAISGLVTFFTKTELGGDLVKATLIALSIPVGILALAFTLLAVSAVADFLATIPALVGGFLTGAAAAWTMAIGVIAATWPFLVVIAVIALIILAIQHWGDIVKWLTAAWGAISTFFVGLWGGISTFFVGIWNDIVVHAEQAGYAISGWWTKLWTGIIKALKDAWQAVVDAVKAAGQYLLTIIIAAFRAIGDAFIWLYNHNYYVHNLVDNIVGAFKACVAWIQNAWNVTVAWLVGLWQGIVSTATKVWNTIVSAITTAFHAVVSVTTTAWNAVVSAIMTVVNAVSSWLQKQWNTISSWLTAAWNTVVKVATDLWNKVSTAVHDAWVKAVGFVSSVWNQISSFFVNAWNNYIVKPLTDLWNNVCNVFSSAWNTYISKPMTDLWNSISQWFTDLGNHAKDSGKNFINMIVDGINSGVGSIWNAVCNIANTIWKALGFHSPAKEGPGSDADTWMPNLVSMLSGDLNAGVPKIQTAVSAMAQPLSTLSSTQIGPNADKWATDLVSKLSGDLTAGASKIQAAVTAMTQPLATLSGTQIGPNADKWATDLVSKLSTDLSSGVSKIQTAVSAMAQPLASLSSTQIGPNADKWATDLVSKLSNDLSAGASKIQAAVNAMTQPLASLGNSSAQSAASPVAAAAPQSTANTNNAIAIHVHLDGTSGTNAQKHGKDIADVVRKELAKTLRQQSVAPRYTSGGSHH